MGMVRRRTRRRTMMVAGGMAYARKKPRPKRRPLRMRRPTPNLRPPLRHRRHRMPMMLPANWSGSLRCTSRVPSPTRNSPPPSRRFSARSASP